MTIAATTSESIATAGRFRKRVLTPNQTVLLLLLPASFLLGLLAICTLAVLRISFAEKNAEWTTWSVEAYARFADTYFISILADTLWLALLSAFMTTIISFPAALFMVRTQYPVLRRVVLICIMLPMLISLLVQSFGWYAVLGPDGLLNQVYKWLFSTDQGLSLLFNRTGVLMGLVQTTVPLAVLPIVASLQSIPHELEEAAGVLGAPRWKVYLHVILPLAWPGIAAGLVLAFGFNTGAFIVPMLLGGLKVTTLAIEIRDQVGTLLNWPMAAALSVVLIGFALVVQAIQKWLSRQILEVEQSDAQ